MNTRDEYEAVAAISTQEHQGRRKIVYVPGEHERRFWTAEPCFGEQLRGKRTTSFDHRGVWHSRIAPRQRLTLRSREVWERAAPRGWRRILPDSRKTDAPIVVVHAPAAV
jgi:hypothetical protein